jgi:hypothetical protein
MWGGGVQSSPLPDWAVLMPAAHFSSRIIAVVPKMKGAFNKSGIKGRSLVSMNSTLAIPHLLIVLTNASGLPYIFLLWGGGGGAAPKDVFLFFVVGPPAPAPPTTSDSLVS